MNASPATNARIPSERKSGYIPTLDGWRAIAVLAVLINHDIYLPEGPIISRIHGWGALGVDLFFAISGILICTRLLEEERIYGRIHLKSFYGRRTFRIFPPAYLFLGVAAVLMLLRIVPNTHPVWPSWWSAVLFFRNYFSNFVPDTLPSRLTGHFWSLAVEEHFYLLLPAILVLFPRRRIAALTAFTVAAFTWLIVYVSTRPPMLRDLFWQRRTDLRLQSLLFPALLAVLLARPAVRAWFQRYITLRNIGIFFIVLFFVGLAKHFSHAPLPIQVAPPDPANPGNFLPVRETQLQPFPVFIAPIFFPLLLIATMLNPASWLSRILEWKPLRAIGRISYSIYLWQELFWVPTGNHLWPIYHLQTPLIGLVLTFVAATASYFFIEKPAIRLGHRFFPPPTPGHADLRENPAPVAAPHNSHSTA